MPQVFCFYTAVILWGVFEQKRSLWNIEVRFDHTDHDLILQLASMQWGKNMKICRPLLRLEFWELGKH